MDCEEIQKIEIPSTHSAYHLSWLIELPSKLKKFTANSTTESNETVWNLFKGNNVTKE